MFVCVQDVSACIYCWEESIMFGCCLMWHHELVQEMGGEKRGRNKNQEPESKEGGGARERD